MNKFAFILLTIVIVATTALGQKTAVGKIDPAQGVRDVFDRLVEGIKQVDVDKVMGTYEKSDRLLIFNHNGSATIGWENVKTNNEKLYPKLKNVNLEITGLRVEMLGKTAAYISCKWKQTQDNDGKFETASGRMTLVFKVIGKDWKIVHRQTSPDNPPPTSPVFPSERTGSL